MNLQITNTYTKAYVEILEIINYMGQEYKKKIPSRLLSFFEENKNLDYEYKLESLNSNKSFLNETLILLALIEQKYWATDKEREILIKGLKENEKKYQESLSEKYNPDNLFKDKIEEIKTIENTVALVEYKESIFRKFINKIKVIFHIN